MLKQRILNQLFRLRSFMQAELLHEIRELRGAQARLQTHYEQLIALHAGLHSEYERLRIEHEGLAAKLDRMDLFDETARSIEAGLLSLALRQTKAQETTSETRSG
jgi:hypothetical protein